jgi:hypothetical protein
MSPTTEAPESMKQQAGRGVSTLIYDLKDIDKYSYQDSIQLTANIEQHHSKNSLDFTKQIPLSHTGLGHLSVARGVKLNSQLGQVPESDKKERGEKWKEEESVFRQKSRSMVGVAGKLEKQTSGLFLDQDIYIQDRVHAPSIGHPRFKSKTRIDTLPRIHSSKKDSIQLLFNFPSISVPNHTPTQDITFIDKRNLPSHHLNIEVPSDSNRTRVIDTDRAEKEHSENVQSMQVLNPLTGRKQGGVRQRLNLSVAPRFRQAAEARSKFVSPSNFHIGLQDKIFTLNDPSPTSLQTSRPIIGLSPLKSQKNTGLNLEVTKGEEKEGTLTGRGGLVRQEKYL